MRIGTDVSIQTCRAEGYMVMDYRVRDFKKAPTTTDCRLTRSIPDYCRFGYIGEKIIRLDIMLNYNDLFELYKDNKNGIDSLIGGEYIRTETPKPFELLHLAQDIDMYCGLV
jgi:hypothetical protein